MQTVQSLLGKLDGFIPREVKIKNTIIDCVSGLYNIDLNKKNIIVSSFTIHFDCPSQVKYILRTKQDILKECVNKKLGYELQIFI